jgi:hypothetical protein
MEQKQKQLLGLTAFGIIIIASIVGFYILTNKTNNNQNQDETGTNNQTEMCEWDNDPFRLNYPQTVSNLTLIINYNNGTTISYSNCTLNNSYTSAFDLLRAYARVEFYCQKFGQRNSFFVTSVDGRAQDAVEGRYWQYWVNGVYAQVASNVYVCQDNDVIEWRYT